MPIENAATYVGISLVFGSIKAYIRGQTHNWATWSIGMLASICVAVISGYVCEDFAVSSGVKFAIVAASALTADSIMMSILKLGDMIQRDPIGTFNRLRGKDERKN